MPFVRPRSQHILLPNGVASMGLRQNNWPTTGLITSLVCGKTIALGTTLVKTDFVDGELLASATYDSYGFWLYASNTSKAAIQGDTMFEIGIGASGSEQSITPGIMCGYRSNTSCHVYFIPKFIPVGSRVAIRVLSKLSSADVNDPNFSIELVPRRTLPGLDVYRNIEAIGTDQATARGTIITSGNNAFGSFANIGSPTALKGKAFMVTIGGNNTNALTQQQYFFRVGIVSGGVDTVLHEFGSQSGTSETHSAITPFIPIPYDLPIGTQFRACHRTGQNNIPIEIGVYVFS